MAKKLKNKSSKKVDEDAKVKKNIQKIKHKIVIMSGKGGVGKSTIATNLALSLSMQGAEVGLLDVDITGPNIPKMLNIEDERLMTNKNGIIPIILPPHLKVMSMAFLLKLTERKSEAVMKIGLSGAMHPSSFGIVFILLPPAIPPRYRSPLVMAKSPEMF